MRVKPYTKRPTQLPACSLNPDPDLVDCEEMSKGADPGHVTTKLRFAESLAEQAITRQAAATEHVDRGFVGKPARKTVQIPVPHKQGQAKLTPGSASARKESDLDLIVAQRTGSPDEFQDALVAVGEPHGSRWFASRAGPERIRDERG
jgi:hypothetical protein